VPEKHRSRRGHEEQEEHVNHEAWVIPYADMLTLLMGLFLVLWSMSTTDLAKLEKLSQSLREGFGVASPANDAAASAIDTGSNGLLAAEAGPDLGVERRSDPVQVDRAFDALDRERAHEQALDAANRELDDIEARITQSAADAGVAESIGLRREERGLVVTVVTDEVLFAPGAADLAAGGRIVLDALVPALQGFDNPLAIEGHTDDRPIATDRFPSNWELSTARATSVLRYLAEAHGFAGGRLTASGYGAERPIGDNTIDAGRAANRRVELVVLADVPLGPSGPAERTGEGPSGPAERMTEEETDG
jgi:chemotaxis protein MotB